MEESPSKIECHKIYIIYSESSIDELRTFLENCSEKKDVGIMRLDHSRNLLDKTHNETNRTLVSLNPKLYKDLEEAGYSDKSEYDFKIKPYDIRENNHPPENCCYSLYLALPLDKLSLEDIQSQLNNKFNEIVSIGLLSPGEFKINYVVNTGIKKAERSREKKGYKSSYPTSPGSPISLKSDISDISSVFFGNPYFSTYFGVQ